MGIQTAEDAAARTEKEQRHGSNHDEHGFRNERGETGMRTAAQTSRVYGLSDIQIRICAKCGKRFATLSPAYAYKIEKSTGGKAYRWYCSYSCMRAIQKPLEEERRAQFKERVRRDTLNLDALEAYRAAQEKKKQEKERERARQEAQAQEKLSEKDNALIGAMVERMRRKEAKGKEQSTEKPEKSKSTDMQGHARQEQ